MKIPFLLLLALFPCQIGLARDLPEQFTLRYAVHMGDGGLRLGDAVYQWRARDGRYSLTSTAEASGPAALLLSGRLVQVSHGRLGEQGLKPEQYWLVKKEKKRDVAQFDWQRGRLAQEGEQLALPAGTQDLLSFPFHLAMTLRPDAAEWSLWVTNGRKLRDYRFRNLGREKLQVAGDEVETIHLQGSRAGEEGSLDVWLMPQRHGLPARIRTEDHKGKVTRLSLEQGV